MRHLKDTDYNTMAWKNGAGRTTEIAISPENTNLSGPPFVWRVSIAEVEADGPFSRFPGYDRLIMLLEGKGMALEAGPLFKLDLKERLRPMSFPGELQVAARLASGPSRDFNVIVDRSRARGRLSVHEIKGKPLEMAGDADETLVYVLEGTIHLSAKGLSYRADRSETLLELDRTLGRTSIAAESPGATIALVEVVRLSP